MVGSFVEARIEGKPIEDIIRMDRDYLRQNDTVWIMAEGVLRIRAVDIVFRDQDYVYIPGLQPKIVIATADLELDDGSRLELVRDGEYVIEF